LGCFGSYFIALKNDNKKIFLGILFLLFGYLLHQKETECFNKRINLFTQKKTSLIAYIDDINKNHQSGLFTITIKLKKFKIGTQWFHATDSFLIYTTKASFLKAADTVIISDITLAKIDEKNKGQLRRMKCTAIAFHPRYIKRIYRPSWSIKCFLHEQKNKIKERLRKNLAQSEYTLLSSIFLGKKEPEDLYRIRKTFNAWGITHYLARSGLHLAIIFVLLSTLLNVFLIPLTLKALFIAIICILYTSLSWQSISFTRSLLLMLSYQICTILKLPINSLHLLNIILLGCVISHTNLIFQLDFQLTFILTYSLILINKYKLLSPPV
jgi:hypothetical protein